LHLVRLFANHQTSHRFPLRDWEVIEWQNCPEGADRILALSMVRLEASELSEEHNDLPQSESRKVSDSPLGALVRLTRIDFLDIVY